MLRDLRPRGIRLSAVVAAGVDLKHVGGAGSYQQPKGYVNYEKASGRVG